MQTDFHFRKIYLDTCCLSRLFDPPTQTRIRQEAEAIYQILRYCFSGHWHWIVSDVLSDEVDQSSNLGMRFQIKKMNILEMTENELYEAGLKEQQPMPDKDTRVIPNQQTHAAEPRD